MAPLYGYQRLPQGGGGECRRACGRTLPSAADAAPSARAPRDLQSFVDAMTLAHRNGAKNEADPPKRRADFIRQSSLPLFWDGEVPEGLNSYDHTQLITNSLAPFIDLNNSKAKVHNLTIDVASCGCTRNWGSRFGWVTPKIRFIGNEGEWTKNGHIVTQDGCFWKPD
jgi:hypothetical protein